MMSISLFRVHEAAVTQIEVVKEQSKTGLAYALAQHRLTIVNVNVEPIHIFLPFEGDAGQMYVLLIVFNCHVS